ncbi:MAG: hypothetical protein GX640_14235 [Fibrobacter sp.]|nr:hypothetical protein [Fibrobacter sp.]
MNTSNTLFAKDTTGATPVKLSSVLSSKDFFNNFLCRISSKFRMNYKIDPGLYTIGNPTSDSPVLVTANYKLTVNVLRAELEKFDIWLLVIDTRGINVWCAAGKGTFCTKEIVKQIKSSDLLSKVEHDQLILPQLGASGVNSWKLYKESGFNVKFGPVRASDIPVYLQNNFTATQEMRRVRFGFTDRAKLVPMEAIPAFKSAFLVILCIAVLSGITKEGVIFKKAIGGVLPFAIAGLTSILTGTILTPLLLPVIPFRAFSIKGLFTGIAGLLLLLFFIPVFRSNPCLLAVSLIVVPAYSSYLALLFTGSTTYTSPSGVKKEMKAALPVYLICAGISIVLCLLYFVNFWGIL